MHYFSSSGEEEEKAKRSLRRGRDAGAQPPRILRDPRGPGAAGAGATRVPRPRPRPSHHSGGKGGQLEFWGHMCADWGLSDESSSHLARKIRLGVEFSHSRGKLGISGRGGKQ